MKRFYGNDIDKLQVEQLLQATPFKKELRINFKHQLTPKVFFEYLYADQRGELTSEERIECVNFDKRIAESLRRVDDTYAKVDLIHICGYAGCGKTTFLRHLLWEKYPEYQQYVIDFEGERTVCEAYIRTVAQKIAETLPKRTERLERAEQLKQLDLLRFGNAATNVMAFVDELTSYEDISQEQAASLLRKTFCCCRTPESESLQSLLLLDFVLAIFDNARMRLSMPLFVVFDNVDSLDDLSQEHMLVTALKKFTNECNFFFADNLPNCREVLGQKIKDVLEQTKFVCFLTTRVATFKQYLTLEPDLEGVYGWVSLTMPEKYYCHSEIIRKRIGFYESMEAGHKSAMIDKLKAIRKFSDYAYRSNVFMKLFNGNIRYCMKTICEMRDKYESTGLITEGRLLTLRRDSIPEAVDGSNGIIISMVLHHFKENGIYIDKLHLSECQRDDSISLSRIILTILREKNGTCSMLDIYLLLAPFFNADTINECVFDLSETCRDNWRRLLVFSEIIPHASGDLRSQYEAFRDKEYTISKYSTIHICTAGVAYIENIVPHFEFMLSRHKSTYAYASNKNYHPLFAESSEDLLPQREQTELCKYRFERKIDWVYSDVYDCCCNSNAFAKQIMDYYKISASEYINSSYYNYRSATHGYRQSYGARLIFSHVGYVERYRRFILSKVGTTLETNIKSDINQRLVSRIKRYLQLYLNESLCYKTDRQDEVAQYLMQAIGIIEDSDYKDYITRIEMV